MMKLLSHHIAVKNAVSEGITSGMPPISGLGIFDILCEGVPQVIVDGNAQVLRSVVGIKLETDFPRRVSVTVIIAVAVGEFSFSRTAFTIGDSGRCGHGMRELRVRADN